MNYLLRSEANYADEFDIEGLLEITKEQRDTLIKNNMSFPDNKSEDEDDIYWDEGDVCFGTNEYVTYEDIELKIIEVTDEELLVLKRVYDIKPERKLKVGTLNLESHL